MCKERAIFLIAGLIILTGTVLTIITKNFWWLAMPAFVGVNMFQAALTGFCPLTKILNAFKVSACTGGPTA